MLKENARKSDIVCRYGGEEFILVLPDTSLDAAGRYAEKLRNLFATLSLTFHTKEIRGTLSLGVAAYPLHGSHYEEIIRKADEALYQSKTNGRNRVTIWSESFSQNKLAI
jgi:diguanylate cyclase (GGDEF)-like protein